MKSVIHNGGTPYICPHGVEVVFQQCHDCARDGYMRKLGGTMSEEQVLPELDVNDIKAVAEMRDSMKVIDRTRRYMEVRVDRLDEYLYELAAVREAKRTNNEPMPQWLRLELAEVGLYFDHDGEPYNQMANMLSAQLGESSAALIGARSSLAQSEAERERLREARILDQEIIMAKCTEVARERELHQGLRQVLNEYRTTSRAHGTLCSHFFNNGNEICSLCTKADALLEDKSKPTTS